MVAHRGWVTPWAAGCCPRRGGGGARVGLIAAPVVGGPPGSAIVKVTSKDGHFLVILVLGVGEYFLFLDSF